jgi:hypothetical protein
VKSGNPWPLNFATNLMCLVKRYYSMDVIKEDLPDVNDYVDSYIAFIDILGFNQKVKSIKSPADFFEIGKLIYTMKSVASNYSTAEGLLENFKFTAISDSIIVTIRFDDPIALYGLVNILHHIQYGLLATGFKTLCRGYIDRGPVYHKEGLLFGAGYCDAYASENQIGGAPRIVISPSIITYAKQVVNQHTSKKTMMSVFDFIKEDRSDGFYFVDYLKPAGAVSLLRGKQLIDDRTSIKRFIDKCLDEYKTNYYIRAKYKWLENYFDDSARYFEKMNNT